MSQSRIFGDGILFYHAWSMGLQFGLRACIYDRPEELAHTWLILFTIWASRGRGQYKFIDQLAAGVVGGRDDGSMGRKGVVKERLLLIVSVTTQVTIWRRVP